MSKVITLPNKCPDVRVCIENKSYRIFSMKYSHPSEPGEDAWKVFPFEDRPILIDTETMKALEGHTVQWLCPKSSENNEEPTILACEISWKKELDTIND